MIFSKSMTVLLLCGLTVSAYCQKNYMPPGESLPQLYGIDFIKADPVNEDYRQIFVNCDNEKKSVCHNDPNRLKALLKFPDGTIFYESKLSLDLDGTWLACSGMPGETDQCATAYQWTAFPTEEEYESEDRKYIFYEKKAFVDGEKFPYIVIPEDPRFSELTGLSTGDLGIVIYRDKIVPVFVADTGPEERGKIGEGSPALFTMLGEDRCRSKVITGNCTEYKESSVEDSVLFFIFPKSAVSNLKEENALEVIRKKALKRFENLKKSLNGDSVKNHERSRRVSISKKTR